MGNADADAVGLKRRWWWLCTATALIAILFAIAGTTENYQKVPFFGSIYNKFNKCRLGSRTYTGMVEGCCCDYETVDSLKEEVLDPILQKLVTNAFF